MGSVDEVRERLPIEQVVGEVVQLKRAGSSYKGLCPFHNEKSPSFIVTPSRGTYKCFGCGESGTIFDFVMKTRNMDFRGALEMLAAKAGVALEDRFEGRETDTIKARLYEMNADAATYFQAMLAGPAGAKARAYLDSRAVTGEAIERFALGYAPDGRDALAKHLREKGFTDEELVLGGLLHAADDRGPARDRFWNRVIFPIRDAKGRLLGFGGRLIESGEPKYLNSPATPTFDKSRVLFAIEHAADAVRSAREGVIVEGYMDALRAHQAGFTNVVATLGTAITEYQLRGLARLAPRLVLALDADPAGQKAAVRAGLAALSALPKTAAPTTPGAPRRESVQVCVARLPEGQDPDDAIRADPEGWRRAVADAVPLMDHYFTLVENELDRAKPEWRQEAIDTLVPAIGSLDGLGAQQEYIERLAELTGVDARYLRDITPGKAPSGVGRNARRRASTDAPRPSGESLPVADPARITEEYLIGLLLVHRPLQPETRAALASYTPLTPALAPLFAALAEDAEPGEAHEETIERLTLAAQGRPPLPPGAVTAELHACIARLNDERARRQLREMALVAGEVDEETVREVDRRTAEMIVLKEQYALRLQREQAQRWRSVPVDDGQAS